MKRALLTIVSLLFVVSGATAHNPKAWRKLRQDINFIWASDLDREGCYDQKVVANVMGEMAGAIKPVCIISTGDTHHGNGVKSIHDDDWKKNFEDVCEERRAAFAEIEDWDQELYTKMVKKMFAEDTISNPVKKYTGEVEEVSTANMPSASAIPLLVAEQNAWIAKYNELYAN